MARVLIAGASGVVGQPAVTAFVDAGWEVVAVSRRAPDLRPGPNWRHVPLDLLDAEACRRAVSEIAGVTHVVYAALYEKPGLVKGWRDEGQMAINLAMLRNLLTPLKESRWLAHLSLLQGTKAYGVHIRPFPAPAKESWLRHPHRNFYWMQEDWVHEELVPRGIGFTIFRPQVIFGDATGVAMNVTPVLAAYGALCRELGCAFAYPGGPDYLLEGLDARLLAGALLWAATAPTARNETFNITNGDVFCWRYIWPVIADALGLEPGPDRPLSLGDWLPRQESTWQTIVARHNLRPTTLTALLGESHHYADFIMATGASRSPQPVLVSTIKLRQAGFGACMDTEKMFRELLGQLAGKRVVPMPGSA
jgi:nucleoside-diphosphate-sugar epimerase